MDELRAKITQKKAEYLATVKRCGIEKDLIDKAELRLKNLREALDIAQGVAQSIQEKVHEQITDVVCRCLEAVFEEPYSFNTVFEMKRRRTEARLVFTKDGAEVDPMTASGGGVVDVAAFALRLAALALQRPPLRRTLVLDEPFKFLSEEYRPRIADLLDLLSSEMGVQFIMVTHIKEFEVGKVINISK